MVDEHAPSEEPVEEPGGVLAAAAAPGARGRPAAASARRAPRRLGAVAERRRQRALSDTLVVLARGQVPAVDPAVRDVPSDLVAAVRYHRLAPLAHVLLRETEPELAALVKADRDHARSLHLHVTSLLGHLDSLLHGLLWAAVKGPVLSEVAHPVPGLRTYNDIDVLVAPRHLREVCERLLAAGWTIDDYEDMLHFRELPGQMHWRSPSGVQLDLHWNLVNEAWRRRKWLVSTDELLERRVPVDLGFFRGWTLDPVDGLVHVCLHGALTGAKKLIYLVDAQRMAARVDDWPEVGRRARRWGAHPHVYLVLRRAQLSLGGPLPPDIARLLHASPAFRSLTTAVDRLAPVKHARTEPGVARLVARAVRPGAARTALAASRSTARYLFGRPAPAPGVRVRGDTEALDAYLSRVETASTGGETW